MALVDGKDDSADAVTRIGAPDFQKLLTRKHALLTDDIIVTAWNDQKRFERLTSFPDFVSNLEAIDGDFCFDFHWIQKIVDRYRDLDLKRFWKFIEDGYHYGEIVKDYSRHLKVGSNRKDLVKQFETSVDLLKDLLVFLPITHPLVKIIESKVIEILRSKNISQDELNSVLFEVSAPIKKNTSVLEHENLLNIKQHSQADRDFDVDESIEKHVDAYGFLGYREAFSSGFDKQFFKAKLQDWSADPTLPAISRVQFTGDERKYVDLLKEFVYFRTYRTEKLYESLYYLEPLWKELSCAFGLTNAIDIGWYTLNEIKSLFTSGAKISDSELEHRKSKHALLLHNNKLEIIFADKVSEYKKRHYPDLVLGENMIRGVSACKGNVRGVAKIVRSAKEQDKINEGDILVTAMTTPDFLPSMYRAAAFVTDEGGITCHAAIVAREMNKPCVIATKMATRVLKDGDLIEVDGNRGLVNILR